MSASATEAQKKITISESVSLNREVFPFLSGNQAEAIYRSNFNTHRAEELVSIDKRYGAYSALMHSALKGFVEYNMCSREGYIFKEGDFSQLKRIMLLCKHFDISVERIRWEGQVPGPRLAFLRAIDAIRARARVCPSGVIVHFVRSFSSPSETFIYDLIRDWEELDPQTLHVVLCDERLLNKERAFNNVAALPWNDLSDVERTFLYDFFWQQVDARLVVCHFALNAYWLHRRIGEECQSIPRIIMCHGIDVYSMFADEAYRKFIINFCSENPRVEFTAVSKYLKGLLEQAGVPSNRITLIPNAASSRFWENRKTSGFYSPERELRILSIGRLIGWKGHDVLLKAIGLVINERKIRLSATIVYGSIDTELPRLSSLINEIGLTGMVNFVPFVNTEKNPAYFSEFDLFILPSTTDESTPPRTETFGVSLLEAILAGLPVIGTDTGGIPEVIGRAGPQAQVCEHGSPRSLASA